MDRRQAIQRTALVLGYSLSAPAIMGILKGCKATPDLAFKPVFLNPDQAAIIAEVAEIIIPKTDTPGAKDAGVPAFIDLMVKDCYAQADQERFTKGIADLDAAASKSHGKSFLDCAPEQQQELVNAGHKEARAAMKSSEPPKDKPFILMVKELTLLGFFTSEPGATQVLSYSAVPGQYQGCVPFGTKVQDTEGTEFTIGKTWAS
ncbi:MAG: gluconate 2-dehydrogenase subunit 3 family protein [Bacteroidota bacterium]